MLLLFDSNKSFWLEVRCIKQPNTNIKMRCIIMGENRLFCTDENYLTKEKNQKKNLTVPELKLWTCPTPELPLPRQTLSLNS